MSVTFANVTDIKIPEGNVTKIQETSGLKRVLWEKDDSEKYKGDTKYYFLKYKRSNGDIYYGSCLQKNGKTIKDLEGQHSFALKATDLTTTSLTSNVNYNEIIKVSVGDEFTMCYVKGPKSLLWPSSIPQKMTIMDLLIHNEITEISDVTWDISTAGAYSQGAIFYPSTILENVNGILSSSPSPCITFSTVNSGNTIKISSIMTKINEYKTILESDWGAKYSKSSYPYIGGLSSIRVISASEPIYFGNDTYVSTLTKPNRTREFAVYFLATR